MKKIGLVGGTGPESTLMYYRELNGRIDRLTGSGAMPEIAVESVDFRRAWNLVSSGDYGTLAGYLAGKIENLSRIGCGVISLTAATILLLNPGNCPVDCLDSVEIHIRELVRLAMS